jgi:hypothetical protein
VRERERERESEKERERDFEDSIWYFWKSIINIEQINKQ